MDDKPRAYRDFIRVPTGGGAVHMIPNLWDSETENNLLRRLTMEETGHRMAASIVDSFDYLLSDAITLTEARRRLRILRKARSELAGHVA